jgi:hypothetical protein
MAENANVHMSVKRGSVTRFTPAKDGKTRQWMNIATGDGELKVTSETIDLSKIPTLVPLSFEMDIVPAIWGNSLILELQTPPVVNPVK